MNLNKHFTILLVSCIALLSMGVSCKDKNKSYCEKNPTECPDIKEVKEYFAFKEDSWWVYEKEGTLERDSVYITAYSNNSSNYYFDVRFYSSYQNYYYHIWPEYAWGINSCNETGAISDKCVLVKKSKYTPGEFVGENYCFFFKVVKGAQIANYNPVFTNNRVIADDILESYSLNSLSFGKTIKIKELNTYIEGKQPTYHYYSKGVGLVRKELLDSNEVWNLVNYHIVA